VIDVNNAMNDKLFVADHIRCAYRNEQLVLTLDHLHVGYGDLLFVLGRSGIGKSTFLELAGLMNLPKHEASGKLYLGGDMQFEGNILDLWNQNNEIISKFRNRRFSFIFQETNLLDSFSAGENMCLPAMIQGMPADIAQGKVMEMMQELGLPPELFDMHPNHLSGGQKQRMAFIRALLPDFLVLFGDEPTGNLDTITADQLMTMLSRVLKVNQRAAILVSHDLRLASRFADKIAVITPSVNDPGAGCLLPDNYFERKGDWRSHNISYSEEELVIKLSQLIRNET
jgi:ABC-type lipoprotein export system ATPase subunit